MTHTIYIFAHDSQIKIASLEQKGLTVNVGETSRTTRQRLKDPDYKLKQAGGKYRCLYEQRVSTSLKDGHIHRKLRMHPRVAHTRSRNTEEYKFFDDTGDGKIAAQIVKDIIRGLGHISPSAGPIQRYEKVNPRRRYLSGAQSEHIGICNPHPIPANTAPHRTVPPPSRPPHAISERIVNNWEAQFLASIEEQLQNNSRGLTNKQKKKFNEIYSSYTRRGYVPNERMRGLKLSSESTFRQARESLWPSVIVTLFASSVLYGFISFLSKIPG